MGQPLSFGLVAVLALLIVTTAPCLAEQAPISIDSLYDDWAGIAVAYVDSTGDGGAIDLGRLWIADDDRFLFLRYETGGESDPSENQDVRIYLDTDANASTGLAIADIGAELEWRTGSRNGTFYGGGGSVFVDQADIRYRGAATITATQFEVAFGRDKLPDGVNPLFPGSAVRVAIVDNTSGDRLPNAGETVSYTFDVGSAPQPAAIPLERQKPGGLRMVTYNVLSDGPWSGAKEPGFARQLGALDPDIISFQEIYSHTASQTAALVESWLPSGSGETWHSTEVADCIIVSRYPVLGSWSLDNNLAALIDTTDWIGRNMLVVSAHLPCCANDSGRQFEIDRIMAFIRDAQQPGGTLELDPNTPIVITGDLNLVGFAQQLTTLLTGDIVNESPFGPDFVPDWDGTDLANLISRQTEKRMAYTWRNDGSSFWPGHLDYIIYTDSLLSADHHFVLYTPEMSAANLTAYGLQANDSTVSDHLPFCADLYPTPFLRADFNADGDVDLIDYASFAECLAGPGKTPPPLAGGVTTAQCLFAFDLDDDGDVDLRDATAFNDALMQ